MSSTKLSDFESHGAIVSVETEDWNSPVHIQSRVDTNLLRLNLPPVRYDGKMRFPEVTGGSLHNVGRSFFLAAGSLVESWGTGGPARSLRCSVSQQRVQRTLNIEKNWFPEQVVRSCDLQRSGVPTILNRMYSEMHGPGMGHAAAMDSLLSLAIVELARFLWPGTVTEIRSGRLTRQQLQRIEDRVRCENLPPPSVAQLAALCGMCERHLLRLFRSSTGESVSGFIRRELAARAQRMLTETELPLKQIAHQLGFSGPSSFTLAFRRATNTTPARYRSSQYAPRSA